jgi:hypothetical protein
MVTLQLLEPSLSYPFYDDAFFTRTSVQGDVQGEGLPLIGGYSVAGSPSGDSFVGWT